LSRDTSSDFNKLQHPSGTVSASQAKDGKIDSRPLLLTGPNVCCKRHGYQTTGNLTECCLYIYRTAYFDQHYFRYCQRVTL